MTRAASAVVLALVLAPTIAAANAARPTTYEVAVEGDTVRICPVNFDGRACPDEGGMLRENPQTGEVVKLPDDCDAGCYVDRCVSPGTYRYGFARPYACVKVSASTDYFTPATVTARASECIRKPDDPVPTAYAAKLPWRNDPEICSYDMLCGACTSPTPARDATMATVVLLWILCAARRRRARS